MLSLELTILLRDPHAHHQRRKLLSRGFSQAALVEFEPEVGAKIEDLLDQWLKVARKDKVVDIYPWAHMLGFDVICKQNFVYSTISG
jgi:benzoate 4-monooxygenase